MKESKKKEKKVSTVMQKRSFKLNLEAWILILPLVLVLYLHVWRPTVMGAFMSFFKMQGYRLASFCGFDNYIKVVTHTHFFTILINTVKYVLWSLILGYLPPLIIATMLNELVHARSKLRVIIYTPVIVPGITAMLIWYFIFYPDGSGLLNALLARFGIAPYGWLNNENFAIPGIIIYQTWKSFGGAMLLYFAALQNVSTELYEAALLDGASPIKRFMHVTFPAIEGLLLLNLVNQIISVFQIMEQPMAMTSGGPNGASKTLGLQLFDYGFNSAGKGTGQAMALGVIIFVILMLVTIFYFRLEKKVEERR